MSTSFPSLPKLGNLPSLGDILKNSVDTGLENAIPGASAISSVASSLGGDTLVSKLTTANAVAIILGLILIAAGVISFKEVQTVVINSAKAAAV